MLLCLPPKNMQNSSPEPISIIVAARNEAHNLPRILTSIAQIHPHDADYEVIIVNDHSSDASKSVLENWDGKFGIKVIDFYADSEAIVGKKAALQVGIDAAKYDILAFTDADCIIPKGWLREISRVMDADCDYLLGYSTILTNEAENSLSLVNFERSIYYILAAAGLKYRRPITASACNMVYRKSLFEKAGGFAGIGHLQSGDDDLLLMKMAPFIRKAYYNPAPAMQIVSIEGKSVKKKYHKNIRRASKFKYFPGYLKVLSGFIFGYFCFFYAALFLILSGKYLSLLPLVVGVKSAAELILSQRHLALVRQTHIGILYFLQILLFPLQFIFYAIRGTLGKYRWKTG